MKIQWQVSSFRKLKRSKFFDIFCETRRHRNSQKFSRLRDSLTLFQALQYILEGSDSNFGLQRNKTQRRPSFSFDLLAHPRSNQLPLERPKFVRTGKGSP